MYNLKVEEIVILILWGMLILSVVVCQCLESCRASKELNYELQVRQRTLENYKKESSEIQLK